MSDLVLRRIAQNERGTFGSLVDAENKQICVTYELPWKANQHNVSCIPAGSYLLSRYHSPKRGYDVFLLHDVPDRSMVEIHIGNAAPDTDGCILVGTHYGETVKGYGVTESRAAFDAFMGHMQGIDAATLTITDPEPLAIAA